MPVTVTVRTVDDLHARVRASVADLLAAAGTEHVLGAVHDALRWDLDGDGRAAFERLERDLWLLGLPTPQCCFGDDPAAAVRFVAALRLLAGAAPGTAEPLVAAMAARWDR